VIIFTRTDPKQSLSASALRGEGPPNRARKSGLGIEESEGTKHGTHDRNAHGGFTFAVLWTSSASGWGMSSRGVRSRLRR